MEFCLQYLTIKVCNDKPLSINFAVLKMTSTKNEQTKYKQTKKDKDYGK